MAKPIIDYGTVPVAQWNDLQIKEEQVTMVLVNFIPLSHTTLQWVHGSTRTGKTGEHFPVREKLGNFADTEKVREFC